MCPDTLVRDTRLLACPNDSPPAQETSSALAQLGFSDFLDFRHFQMWNISRGFDPQLFSIGMAMATAIIIRKKDQQEWDARL